LLLLPATIPVPLVSWIGLIKDQNPNFEDSEGYGFGLILEQVSSAFIPDIFYSTISLTDFSSSSYISSSTSSLFTT
jgi:hypothetical protein